MKLKDIENKDKILVSNSDLIDNVWEFYLTKEQKAIIYEWWEILVSKEQKR